MDTDRLKTEVSNFKKQLEKANEDFDLERIIDILRLLEPLQISAGLLKSLKLGNLVADTKKKCAGSDGNVAAEIGTVCKNILISWKKTMEESRGAKAKSGKEGNGAVTANAPSTSTSAVAATGGNQSTSASSKNSPPLKLKVSAAESMVQSAAKQLQTLNEPRLKIVNLFAGHFKDDVGDFAQAQGAAVNIEAAIYKLHPRELDSAKYTAKVRSLAFNLKRNENLRRSILAGIVDSDRLVRMSADELATADLKEERQQVKQDDSEGRRLDWVEEHLLEIKEDIGLDPDNVWEYDKESESDFSG
jgi:hypothetical protein